MYSPALRILLVSALLALPVAAANNPSNDAPKNHNEWTVAHLQAAMAAGKLTSEDLTKEYIERIVALDQNGPGVNAVIELNPDALEMARNAEVGAVGVAWGYHEPERLSLAGARAVAATGDELVATIDVCLERAA